MNINKILNSLGQSWQRDAVLLKIKNGLDTDEIVNEFIANNEIQIKNLHNLLRPEDFDLLNQVEKLSTCESKLINKIQNLNYLENNENHQIINQSNISLSHKASHNRFSTFMINWSNKFLIIVLLIISFISLSKQAWA